MRHRKTFILCLITFVFFPFEAYSQIESVEEGYGKSAGYTVVRNKHNACAAMKDLTQSETFGFGKGIINNNKGNKKVFHFITINDPRLDLEMGKYKKGHIYIDEEKISVIYVADSKTTMSAGKERGLLEKLYSAENSVRFSIGDYKRTIQLGKEHRVKAKLQECWSDLKGNKEKINPLK